MKLFSSKNNFADFVFDFKGLVGKEHTGDPAAVDAVKLAEKVGIGVPRQLAIGRVVNESVLVLIGDAASLIEIVVDIAVVLGDPLFLFVRVAGMGLIGEQDLLVRLEAGQHHGTQVEQRRDGGGLVLPVLDSEAGVGAMSNHSNLFRFSVTLGVFVGARLIMVADDVPSDRWRRLDAHVDVAEALKEVGQVVEVGGRLVVVTAAAQMDDPKDEDDNWNNQAGIVRVNCRLLYKLGERDRNIDEGRREQHDGGNEHHQVTAVETLRVILGDLDTLLEHEQLLVLHPVHDLGDDA